MIALNVHIKCLSNEILNIVFFLYSCCQCSRMPNHRFGSMSFSYGIGAFNSCFRSNLCLLFLLFLRSTNRLKYAKIYYFPGGNHNVHCFHANFLFCYKYNNNQLTDRPTERPIINKQEKPFIKYVAYTNCM